MAVSIAVNWTPPASSPLFDEDSAATTSSSLSTSPSPAQSQSPSQSQAQTTDGQPSSSASASASATAGAPASTSASASPSASPSSAPLSSAPAAATNSKSTLAVPAAIPGRTTSPQPRSYAAAAASSPSQSSQQSISPPQSIQRTPSATSSHSPQQRTVSQPQTQQSQQNPPPQQPLHQQPQQPQHFPHHSQHQQQHPQQQQAWAQPPQSQQPPQMPQPAFAGSRNQNMFGPPPQQHPPHHGHNGAGFGPAYNMAFAPPAMPNQFAWAQYQQMLAAQAHNFYGQAPASDVGVGSADPSGRRRTTSGPQRPAPLTYNDTFHQQAYPGLPSYATAGGRGNLPPGAMAPPTGPSAAAPGNSFHPYRRQPRPSDPQPHSPNQFGQQGSSLGAGSQLTAPNPRTRASSTASHDSASRKEATTASSSQPAQPASYSAAASGSLRSQPSNVGAGAAAASAPSRSGPARQGSYSTATAPDGSALPAPPAPTFNIKRPEPPSRTESTKSTSSTTAPTTTATGSETSSPHSRSESVSSQSSVNSTTVSDRASTIGGRTTPTPGSKKPSPLSRSAPPEDDDDDTNAEYGGSDREDGPPDAAGRATPTGDKKKGLGGKLRKALSLHSMNEVQQQHPSDRNAAASRPRPSAAPSGRMPAGFATSPSIAHDPNGSASDSLRSSSPTRPSDFSIGAAPGLAGSSAASISSRRSGRPPLSGSAEGSGKRSLFNRKFNSSTDNISISSTVSSASVMLRKVGNLGKIARRHSLMGLTNMFNKDKEGGRDGLQGDDFGTLGASASGDGDDGAATNGTGKGAKKNKKGKSAPVAASVSHATVELDPNGDGMTPAAHYVRQHQLQMRQQAEAEAKAARERQEAEARAAAAAAASASAKNKGKTTDDVVESRQKMIEKEKERLKSKRGWRNRLRVGGGSSIDQTAAPTGLETIPYPDGNEHDADGALPPGAPQDAYHQQQQLAYSSGPNGSAGPAPQLELGQDFGAGFDDEELEPPHMPAAGGAASGGEDSGDEFETDSLRHWGEGIERSRASAALVKAPKGILKKSVSSSQLDQSFATGAVIERPFAGRVRANSYDAPQSTAPGAPMLSAMSTTTAGAARMDGLTRSGSLSEKDNAQQQQQQQQQQQSNNNPRSSPVAPPTPAPVLGHHSNSSMPTLTLMTNPTAGAGGTVPRPSMQKKRICFTEEHIYHSTWPAHVYDRRGELATCNRLTPLLAQRIKEELNSYKMEEMEVAPSSRIYTHFFV